MQTRSRGWRGRQAWHRWVAPSMGSRIGKNSLFSATGYAVQVLVILVFTPPLLHRMGASNFGLWMLSTAFLGLVGVFDLGLGTTVAKYIAEYHQRGDVDRLSATATMGFLIYLSIGLLLALPIFLLAPQVASLFGDGRADAPRDVIEAIVRLAALSFVPLLLKNAGLAVSIGLQRFKIPMGISVAQSLLTFGVALLVTLGGGSVTQVVVSSLVTLCIMAAISLLIGYQTLRTLGARVVYSRSQARLMFRFTAFTSVTALGSLLFSSADRIAVGVVLGTGAVAYYVVAVGIAANLLIVADVLTRPLMPATSSLIGAGQWHRARMYLVRSTAAIAALELTLSVVLLLVSRPVMTAWLGADVTAHALVPFRALIVAYAVIGVFAPAYHIANGAGFPWLPALGALAGGFMTVFLIIIMGQTWGLAGAAWANSGYWATALILAGTLRALKQRSRPDALARTA
jgi:O-antigen/teichoic acid export membrane protein